MIALALVVIAYALGHIGGYRMCKYRFKNILRRKIQGSSKHDSPYSATVTGVYSSLLKEVASL